MKLPFRYPDNPIQIPPHELIALEREEPGVFIGQNKWDGWRRPLYLESGQDWQQFSKHDAHAKQFPPAKLLDELKTLSFPEGTAFDAEWMGMRAVEHLRGRHYFILFDLLYYGGQWQGNLPYEQRYANLKTLFELHKARAKIATPNIELEPLYTGNLLQMFEKSKKEPLTEGIVIKARDSKLMGKMNACANNGGWLKIKWRA